MSAPIAVEAFKAYAGRTLASSPWVLIDQARVDAFAACTDDPQFIHVDPDRARRESPFGGTIAHGFLLLALISAHGPSDWPQVDGVAFALNYGLDRVRFLVPVRTGSRVRMLSRMIWVEEKEPGRVLFEQEKMLEIEGEARPGYAAEQLGMFMLEANG